MSKIFNKWVKSEAELISGGLTKTSLINDTKIYVTGNSINKRLDEAITDGDIGGGGGINHVTNNEMASNITGYNTYKDAVDVIPENGTAGTATVISISRNTTTPLRNLADLKIAKSGSNGKGEGVSYDVTTDLADQSQIMELSFDYRMTSGYADNDFSIFLYDVTNNVLIRFNGEELKAKSPYGKFIAFPQLSSNSTSYRIIFHCVSTSTTAYDIFIDNVKLGPSNDVSVSNTNISTWTSYTPTFTGLGTCTNISFEWRRVGQNREVRGRFTTGTGTAVEARIGLPFNEITSNTLPSLSICGNMTSNVTGSPHTNLIPLIEPSVGYITIGAVQSTQNQFSKIIGSDWFGAARDISVQFSVPIAGLSAADITNAEYSGRFQTCTLRLATDQSITTAIGMKLAFATVVRDTASMADTSLNRIYARESAFYDLDFSASGSALDLNEKINVEIYINSVWFRSSGFDSSGDNQYWSASMTLKSIELVKGDYVEVYLNSESDAAYTVAGDAGLSWFTLTKIANPVDVVKSNERVYLEYYGNDGDTYSSTPHNVKWKTKVEDTHGAWNGTQFTTPITADYIIEGTCNRSASSTYNIFVKINGAPLTTNPEITQNGITTTIKQLSRIVKLTKGEVLSFEFDSTGHTISNSTYHRLCIRKLN